MTHWSAEALCKNMDGEIFFPYPGDHCGPLRNIICSSCPVTEECLESALTSPLRPSGVWGGRPEAEVQSLWAQRKNQVRRANRRHVIRQLAGVEG